MGLGSLSIEVLQKYLELDDSIREMQSNVGLGCPPGCGVCCENPNVEASILEVFPLAWQLLTLGLAESVYEQLSDIGNVPSVCHFYRKDESIEGNGRCSVYSVRPLLCRLFAYAAIRNRDGKPELAFCKIHKRTQPEVVEFTKKKIGEGMSVPMYRDWSLKISQLRPDLGTELLPLNLAVRKAIEYLYRDWEEQETQEIQVVADNNEFPDKPSGGQKVI